MVNAKIAKIRHFGPFFGKIPENPEKSRKSVFSGFFRGNPPFFPFFPILGIKPRKVPFLAS